MGVLLHRFHHMPAVHLHQVDHVDTPQPQRHLYLDHQLVPRWRLDAGRGVQPPVQFALAARGDPEPLLGAIHLVGDDAAVLLQPVERRIDLADVERPDIAGLGLELLPQLQSILRAFAEQRQQRVSNAHGHFCPSVTIPRTIHSIIAKE